jgi:hypothetical protein
MRGHPVMWLSLHPIPSIDEAWQASLRSRQLGLLASFTPEKHDTFVGFFIFLGTVEYKWTIFPDFKTNECSCHQ